MTSSSFGEKMEEVERFDPMSATPPQSLVERLKDYGQEDAFGLWDDLSAEERSLLVKDIEVCGSLIYISICVCVLGRVCIHARIHVCCLCTICCTYRKMLLSSFNNLF